MNKEKIRGIYKITNIINNKVYIGESLDIERRWNDHKEDLDNNVHHSYKLQADWNEFGEDNFKFEIITVLDKDIKRFSDEYILLIYEDLYIKEFNSINEGYNVEETLERIISGEKKVFEGKNDRYNIEIYQKQIEDKKIINENGLIHNPKYYTFKDLRNKLNVRRPEYLLFNNNIVCKSKIHKYKYTLTKEYENSNDIFLNNEPISSIRFTEKGLEIIYELLKDKL